MWNKIKQMIIRNKMITMCVLGAMVLCVTAAVTIPKMVNPETLRTDNQQTVQQSEEVKQQEQQEQQEQQQQEQPKENPDRSQEAESAGAEEAAKDQVAEKNDNIVDKIIQAITGNAEQKEDNSSSDTSHDSDDGDDEENDNTPDVPTEKKYEVAFVTDGGSDLSKRSIIEGTRISTLPTPYKEGYIFLGWYYDEQHTDSVENRDVVNHDMTLYASYLQETPLEALEQSTFAGARNVSSDFSITVISEDKTMDADAILAGITAENLTDPKQKGIISVTGSNGTFIVKGRNPYEEGVELPVADGFAEGSTFRIILNDARLTFKGQTESVREYHFTTDKEEVINLTLNDDIVYISVEEINNLINDGKAVETLQLALYQAEKDGTVGPAELTEGSFECDKNLSVGDIVTVYAGLRPDLRTFDTPKELLGDVGYIEITGRLGNAYTYKNANAEDVIFTPDMLPVSITADMDGDSKNHSITINKNDFDYSADVYENIDLDSRTTVDVGDFLIFYSGEFGITTGENAAQLLGIYGEITAVTYNEDDTVTVTYVDTDWAEVQEVMDIYTSQRMSGQEMLEGVDTQQIEAQIEQQAIDSGFAEEAAQYLASLALATENFTKLSDNMNLKDYKVTLEDGTPISPEELQLMDNSIKVECELEKGYPKATISIHPKHFEGVDGTDAAGQGLSVSLEIKANITIGKRGSDNQIVITVSGTFVEEVGVDMGLSSKAVWKVWGIFPYIAEYRVTANVDLLNYTGIEVNATMVTKTSDDDDKDDDTGEDITEMIKGLLESKEDGEEEDSKESGNNLVKRYSEMLETESDFIKIVDQNITEKEKQLPPGLPIIAVGFSLDFVVQMDASVSIGFDFEYITGKRYTFAIDVFGAKVQCDTITLIEEKYEFSFYAMGRLAIRAGLEMEFEVGLFSTKLDSVGVTAQGGAYTKLWGYFYYELKYTASQGRSQQYSGALLIEVGAYLEVGLKAQIFDGTFSKELTVVEKEWPLYSVGRADNILDFATEEEKMPNIKLKQHVRSVVIPDSVFLLDYLDLKDGKEKQAVYNDYFDPTKKVSETNRKNFVITMTNEKFTYEPQTNTISVNPAEGDKKLEGEMIITWINYPLAFSSKPIQRTISLYWDNVRDGYVIVPYTNGGSYIPIIEAKYESKVTAPAEPEKMGYHFDGWYSDEELTKPYEFPDKMPAEDFNIYAKWSERTDTTYRVEHYKEQLLSGQYELAETEDFTGTTNSYVTPEVKTYTGYNTPAKQEVKILPDGSAVLRYYYSLQWHQVTFNPGEAGGEEITYDLKYGGKVIAPVMTVKGYTFIGWDKKVDGTMGTEDITYTAQWKENSDIAYRVEYYVQQSDGKYALQHLIEASGYTGNELTARDLRDRMVADELTADEKFAVRDAIMFEKMTVHGVSCETAKIEGSGKTIIKVYYKRLTHKLTLDYGYDDKVEESDVLYGAAVSVTGPKRTGYRFIGWSIDGTTPVAATIKTMGKADIKYIALWEPITYTVAFDKGNGAANGEMEAMQFTYDTAQKLNANTFTVDHYIFAGWARERGGSAAFADGESVKNLAELDGKVITLYAAWKPRKYAITYYGCEDAVNANPISYTVESGAITLFAPTRAAYTFEGWYDNDQLSGDTVTVIETAKGGDRTLYAKWKADTNIAYQVEHYQETLDGSFVLAETDRLAGSVDAPITPAVREYTGFASPQTQQVFIAADGSTIVRYEYTRNEYTIHLNTDSGILPEDSTDVITAKFGTPITLPVPVREGYGFSGWYNGESKFSESLMPAENLTLNARWEEGMYSYTVNHYLQNVNGEGYTLITAQTDTAAMDSEVTAVMNSYTGFTQPSEMKNITIGTDESKNVADYFYERNQYTLTWNLDGGSAEGYTNGSVYYGASIIAPAPVKEGYSYSWDKVPVTEMPAQDLAYTAVWIANTYAVSFDLNGGTVTAGSAVTRNVTFGNAYGELAELIKTGYTFDGWFTDREGGAQVTAETKVVTAANHTVYAHYTPISYSITYDGVTGAANTNPKSYSIETGAITLDAASKEGYTFEGWYETKDFSSAEVKVIPAGSVGDKSYYAKWSENSYTVIFHSNNGADTISNQKFTYTESKALDANAYEKTAYHFVGWSEDKNATTATYVDAQTVNKLTSEANGEVHLYAIWKIVTYDIVYENMEGAENASDNPTSFSPENNVITLHDPHGRMGYTFEGWYTDSSFKNKVSGTMTLDAYHTWKFYAKWTPNPYTITFDSCLGDTVPTESLLMTYDVPANLTPIRDITAFSKPGYTFKGWSKEKDGSVMYTDGQNVINLAAQGNVTLYAVWELNVFKISYNVGTGTISHENPASYSIEDGDVTLAAPVAKDGYQFLGWYEGDTLVSEIVKGTQRDYELTAKWAHGGIFTIELGDADTSVAGYCYQTYIVRRTLPEGTVATANPQYVYYRTLNGTAYGTTVDYSADQDKYHFKHVGGEDVYLTFGPTDFALSFKVQEWNREVHEADAAASFATEGTNRNYQVQLYKVLDTVGTCKGELGETVTCRKTLITGSGNFLTTDFYKWYFNFLYDGTMKVTDAGYSKQYRWTVNGRDILNNNMSDNKEKYRDRIAAKLGFYIKMELREVDDGYQWAQFNYGTSLNQSNQLAEYHFATKDGEVASQWGRTLTLPSDGAAQGDIKFNAGGDCQVTNNWTIAQKSGTTYYAIVDIDKSINFGFDASGKKDDDWQYRNLYVYFKVYDNRAPKQVGLAPMAFGQYKAGDTIALTVIYDEVIANTSNICLGAISGLPITDAVCTGGVGTNALTFTATLTDDFEVTPDFNHSIISLSPVTGTVEDIINNK